MEFYWNEKRQKVQVRAEEVGKEIYYWKVVDGISESITKRQYENQLKKVEQFKQKLI